MIKSSFKKIGVILIATTLLTGCDAVQNANNTQKGAVIGTTAGAVLGGVIGNNVGNKENSVLGAIIGGVVGGVAGGVIGKQMDKQAQKIEEELPGAEVTRVGEGIDIILDENSGVYFDTNKSNINTKSRENLDKLVRIFKEYPDTNIIVDGHTDSSGDDAYNMELSKKRANSVTSYLISQGISKTRLTTYFHGETLPKYDNATAEGRAKNRRVEFGILANDKMIEDAKKTVD
ncbi:OmpA family protein [Aquimarina sp. 2201CG14-23]|uniref:OmpA family protein n=1 Tax=Aquimarina mycalae TaxID=3040073 RepID=UPI002477FF47|nr:OmpA family protein [Aquimarina sp. 2201CG14-23]MDH7446457.1 OmpA family protein [Aquimarina sp. 2201CG14-23]